MVVDDEAVNLKVLELRMSHWVIHEKKEKWEVMKSHTTIGSRILEGGDSELLNVARSL